MKWFQSSGLSDGCKSIHVIFMLFFQEIFKCGMQIPHSLTKKLIFFLLISVQVSLCLRFISIFFKNWASFMFFT